MSSEKRKKLQKEELNTAIAVQAKLQQSRIDFNNNIVPPPIMEVPREELYKNIDYNEKVLKDNIVKLGLTYPKATEIISRLSVDEIMKANAFWNHLNSEILKKFNPRALSPLFFIDYIKSELLSIQNNVTNKLLDEREKINKVNTVIAKINNLKFINEAIEIENQNKENEERTRNLEDFTNKLSQNNFITTREQNSRYRKTPDQIYNLNNKIANDLYTNMSRDPNYLTTLKRPELIKYYMYYHGGKFDNHLTKPDMIDYIRNNNKFDGEFYSDGSIKTVGDFDAIRDKLMKNPSQNFIDQRKAALENNPYYVKNLFNHLDDAKEWEKYMNHKDPTKIHDMMTGYGLKTKT
jgi:hypothetical protein